MYIYHKNANKLITATNNIFQDKNVNALVIMIGKMVNFLKLVVLNGNQEMRAIGVI